MKIIISTNGYKIKISDEDYDFLNQNKWNVAEKTKTVERCIHIDGKQYTIRMAAVILDRQGIAHPVKIDHEDQNPLNNQRENLRPATTSENSINRDLQPNNTSGYKGVSFDTSSNKWRARISFEGERLSLGRFATEEEAARAYDKAAKLHHGKFTTDLNFPEDL